MKKLFRIWMYLCTALGTASLVLLISASIFLREEKNEEIKGVEDPIYAVTDYLHPSIKKLFKAVETNDLKTIYQYAAPELKERISYDLFVQDQWPDRATTDIFVIYSQSASLEGTAVKNIELILTYKENGTKQYGSMRWQITPDSVHYDTIPFKVSVLSEFGAFPTHLTQ